MNPIILIAIGIASAVLYLLITLVRTIRRAEKISFWETLLVYLAVLSPLSGVVLASMNGVPDSLISFVALVFGAAFAIIGLIFALAELRRPQRFKQSRGLLALGAGVLLSISSVAVPAASAYLSVPISEGTAVAQDSAPENASTTADLDEAQRQRFQTLFANLFSIISDETGLDIDGILSSLDEGKTVAQLITDNGGNVENVVDRLTLLLVEEIQGAARRGEITRMQAASGILFAESGVRIAVNNDIRTLQQIGSRNPGDATFTPMPEGESFFTFLTTTPMPQQVAQQATSTPSPPPTNTVIPTLTPSATRTPQPTPTATNTRVLYASPTPTLTPTLPNPCVALMSYNVNMRAEPSLDAELVVTIPFETAISVYGRSEDGEWWFAEYEGDAGWVKDEFVRVTSACESLPVRRTR